MPIVRANGVDLCFETHGDPAAPSVLCIHGHGAQLISWHADLVEALVSLGLHVILFDNRDVGLSTHLLDAPAPDAFAIAGGDHATMAYAIEDMAEDAVALLDALDVRRAHVVGVSMGGMIAQSLAIRHPHRVVTLTSMMSSPDPLRVGTPSPETVERWFVASPTDRASVIDETVRGWHETGSPELGIDDDWVRDLAARLYDRAFDPGGVARQFGAIVGSPDRRPGLADVAVPTLVVHGAIDPTITVEGGIATAKAIRGAELLVIDKMGHDVPRAVWPELLGAFAALVGTAA